MTKETKKSKDKQAPQENPEEAKKIKKPQTTGSRWVALIILALTIILSLIFKLQSGVISSPEGQTNSSGKTWQFTIEESN
jgi:hypothetical protein